MTDFRSSILTNLRIYRDIVEDPDCVEALNDVLNELDAAGFGQLVQKFCTQIEPERADDFLFEIWICQLLRRNQDVQALQYEPLDTKLPPDFRFRLQGVNFDIQVKRLHNTTNKNEAIKLRFVRECRKRLSAIQRPWFINFWISEDFEPRHLDRFFTFLRRSLDQFSPVTTFDTMLGEPQYPWEHDGKVLVKFSFTEKSDQEPGIFPGVISLMTGEPIDTDAFREGVKRLLKKSGKTLTQPISPAQANLLVMQAVHPILFAAQTMPDALYGSKGLFRSGKFSRICGLILVPSKVSFFHDPFEGIYFPNPAHLQNCLSHPQPFEGTDVSYLHSHIGKYVKWRDRSFLTSREPESWVPEAMADLVGGSTSSSHLILLPNEHSERIKRGEILFPTRQQAKIAAYEMAKSFAWQQWGISEERIQEW